MTNPNTDLQKKNDQTENRKRKKNHQSSVPSKTTNINDKSEPPKSKQEPNHQSSPPSNTTKLNDLVPPTETNINKTSPPAPTRKKIKTLQPPDLSTKRTPDKWDGVAEVSEILSSEDSSTGVYYLIVRRKMHHEVEYYMQPLKVGYNNDKITFLTTHFKNIVDGICQMRVPGNPSAFYTACSLNPIYGPQPFQLFYHVKATGNNLDLNTWANKCTKAIIDYLKTQQMQYSPSQIHIEIKDATTTPRISLSDVFFDDHLYAIITLLWNCETKEDLDIILNHPPSLNLLYKTSDAKERLLQLWNHHHPPLH